MHETRRIKTKALTKALLGIAVISAMALSGCKSTKEALKIGDAGERNPGACPRAFALYDAGRIVDFRGDAETFSNVGFTGEIANVRSLCRYYGTEPIVADLEITFDLGRGPAASQSEATYEYFVAVTRKNVDVIEKQVYPLQVRFPAGQDRVRVSDTVDKITIPRATETTSGANFEIVVGFVVTPEQRAFNTDGKRFRVSAGQN